MVIEIKNKPNIDDIEDLYSKIERKKDSIDVLLGNDVRDTDFGIVSSIIQFISTWQRSSCAGALLLDINDDFESLEDIVKEDFIFPSIILCWDKGIFNKDKSINLKSLLKPINEKIMKDMQSLSNLRGFKVLLTCFDHLPKTKGLLETFYHDGKFISGDGVLSFSFNEVIKHILSFNRQASAENIGNVIEDLIGISYELMKNTDDWAITDVDSKPLSPNVRGVFIKFRKAQQKIFAKRYKNHNGLKSYFDCFKPNDYGDIFFLEISVFDSGIGFVNRNLGENKSYRLNMHEQSEVIKSCLIRHNTSAIGLDKDSKGLGLDRIMKLLSNKGFFMLRTSNVFLYRNMMENTYKESVNVSDVILYDWKNNSNSVYNRWDSVVGSSISIIYPISKVS